MTTVVEVFPDAEALVGSILRTANIEGVGARVYSSIPKSPTYPLILVKRIGGIPAELHRLDRARVQIEVWGAPPGGKGEAFEIAAEARAVLFGAEGQTYLTGEATTSDVPTLLETVDPLRSAFQLQDSLTHSMDTLKVVPDPTVSGRYLGVYHWFEDPDFSVGVATSTDLVTWTHQRTLTTSGSQPYLAFDPNDAPILAFESTSAGWGGEWDEDDWGDTAASNHLSFRYWTTVAGMLGVTAPAASFDAPQDLSAFAEGTPNIRSVTYASPSSTIDNGSTIVVGHHYFEDGITDREALGTLTNFDTWNTGIRADVDAALTAAGGPGKHGDRDRFYSGNVPYEVFEATTNEVFSFADWRCFLWDGSTALQLAIGTPGGSTAFANPTVTVMDDPTGDPSLVVTQFIPSEGAAALEGGELIYWNPITPTVTTGWPVNATVTGVEDDLGLTWQPDPATARDRYLFGLAVYLHNSP